MFVLMMLITAVIVALDMCCYLDHSLLILYLDSTVGSNPQGPRHMQLTAPDVQPVTWHQYRYFIHSHLPLADPRHHILR